MERILPSDQMMSVVEFLMAIYTNIRHEDYKNLNYIKIQNFIKLLEYNSLDDLISKIQEIEQKANDNNNNGKILFIRHTFSYENLLDKGRKEHLKLLSHHLRNSPATKLGKELIKDVKKQIENSEELKQELSDYPVLMTSTKSRAMLTGNEIYQTRNQKKHGYKFRTELLNEFFLVEELNPILKENIFEKTKLLFECFPFTNFILAGHSHFFEKFLHQNKKMKNVEGLIYNYKIFLIGNNLNTSQINLEKKKTELFKPNITLDTFPNFMNVALQNIQDTNRNVIKRHINAKKITNTLNYDKGTKVNNNISDKHLKYLKNIIKYLLGTDISDKKFQNLINSYKKSNKKNNNDLTELKKLSKLFKNKHLASSKLFGQHTNKVYKGMKDKLDELIKEHRNNPKEIYEKFFTKKRKNRIKKSINKWFNKECNHKEECRKQKDAITNIKEFLEKKNIL